MYFENSAISVPNPFVQELVNAPHGEVHAEPTDGALLWWQIDIRDWSLTRVEGSTGIIDRDGQGFVVDVSIQFQCALETCFVIPVNNNIGRYFVNRKTQMMGGTLIQVS
jgi:hypothetical protein